MLIGNSIVPLTEKKLKRILDYFLECYTISRDWKENSGYNNLAKECYRFYRGIPIMKPSGYEYQANYWQPLTFTAVETIAPRLMAGLFATDPFFRYLGMSDDDFPGCDNLTKTVNYKLNYEVPFMLQIAKAIKNSLVYGYSIIWSPWMTKVKRRYVRDFMNNAKRVAVGETVMDTTFCKCIPLWDAYPQPTESIYDADYTIIREMVTPAQLYQRALHPDSPYLIESVTKILKNEKGESYPPEADEHYREIDKLVGLGKDEQRSGKIELLHYFGCYDLAAGESNIRPEVSDIESWITVANRTQVVLAIPNPYDCQERPLTEIRPMPNVHGLLGHPIPEIGRDVQLEANDNRNFRLDQLNFIGNKVTKVKRNSDVYDKLQQGDIILYPGETVFVDDMDDIQELAFGSVDPSLYIEGNALRDDFNQTMGIHDINYGKGDSRARTATGTSLIIREANYRFDLMLKHIVPEMMMLMRKIGLLHQQYALMPQTKVSMTAGDVLYPKQRKIFSFSREEIQCSFQSLMLSSSTRGDRSFHFALLQSLRTLLGEDPNINLEELDKQLLEEGELKNIDILLKKMPVTPAPNAAEGGTSSVVAGMGGLGGPTEEKSLRNNLIMMTKDKIMEG